MSDTLLPSSVDFHQTKGAITLLPTKARNAAERSLRQLLRVPYEDAFRFSLASEFGSLRRGRDNAISHTLSENPVALVHPLRPDDPQG
jgi:hypothetical protein